MSFNKQQNQLPENKLNENQSKADKFNEIQSILGQTNEMTNETLLKLDEQNQQIQRIQDVLNENSQVMKQNTHILNLIKSPWYRFKNLFTSGNKSPEQPVIQSVQTQNQIITQSKQVTQPMNDDIQKQLNSINNLVNDIINNQIVIGQSLDEQNQKLTKINDKTDQLTNDMKKATQILKKI